MTKAEIKQLLEERDELYAACKTLSQSLNWSIHSHTFAQFGDRWMKARALAKKALTNVRNGLLSAPKKDSPYKKSFDRGYLLLYKATEGD